MKTVPQVLGVILLAGSLLSVVPAGTAPSVPPEIAALPPDPTPGKNMAQLHPPGFWGELLAVDTATRTVVLRRESDDSVQYIRVLPYAEVLRYSGYGVPLEQFQPGEKVFVGVPTEAQGKYTVIVRDEVHIMFSHNHWYRVESLDTARGELTARYFAGNENVVHPGGKSTTIPSPPGGVITWKLSPETVYYLAGRKAPVASLRPGDMVEIKSRMTGHGRDLVAWEIIDPSSMPVLDREQRESINRYAAAGGVPGYVASAAGDTAVLTLARSFDSYIGAWKAGTKLTVRPAGGGASVPVTFKSRGTSGPNLQLTVSGDAAALAALPTNIAYRIQGAPN